MLIEQIRSEIRKLRHSVGNFDLIYELEKKLPDAELDVWAYFGDWWPELFNVGVILCPANSDNWRILRDCLPGPLGLWPNVPDPYGRAATLGPAETLALWAMPEYQERLERSADSFMPGFIRALVVPTSTDADVLARVWPTSLPPAASKSPRRWNAIEEMAKLKRAADALEWALSYITREPGYFVFVAGAQGGSMLERVSAGLEQNRREFGRIRIQGEDVEWIGSRLYSGGTVI
jgi:hypothetical protein